MDDIPIPIEEVSAVHGLPIDVLGAIFVQCLDTTPYSYRGPRGVMARRFPIVLASICRWWRHVAYTTSELWSTCWFSYDRPMLNSLWLSRAGNRALHLDGSIVPISYNHHESIHDRKHCNVTAFLSSILPYADRWRSLTICPEILSPSPTQILIRYTSKMPYLQSLRTFSAPSVYPGEQAITSWLADILQRSPDIQRLRLAESFQISVLGGLSNLVHLKLDHGIRPWDVFQLLRSAPELENMELKITLWNTPSLLDISHTVHRCLRSVVLDCGPPLRPQKFIPFISLLTLPALQSFVCPSALVPGIPGAIGSFLDRSKCSLKELGFSWGAHFMDEIIALLRHDGIYSSLEAFTFMTGPLTKDFIDFLLPDVDTSTVNLPQLRKLIFYEVDPRFVQGGIIPEMVVSRRQRREGGARLEHFEYTIMEKPFRYWSPYKEDVQTLIRAFANDPMRLMLWL